MRTHAHRPVERALALAAMLALSCATATGCPPDEAPAEKVPTTVARAGGAEAIKPAAGDEPGDGAETKPSTARAPGAKKPKASRQRADNGARKPGEAKTAPPSDEASARRPPAGGSEPAPSPKPSPGAAAAAPATVASAKARPSAGAGGGAEGGVGDEVEGDDGPPPLGPAGVAVVKQMRRPNPIPSVVDSAFGAATEPDADASAWVKAMQQVMREIAQLDAVRDKARKRHQAIVAAGAEGKLPRGGPLAKGFAAHELMVAGLNGATIRVRGPKHLGSPLQGASERGRAFAGMARILALATEDALLARKGPAALQWVTRQARFGALAASAARSYEELAAAANCVQEALALAEVIQARFPKAVAGHEPPLDAAALREHRHRVGEFIAELKAQREFMRDPDHLEDWARLTLEAPSPLWRYEALSALLRVALTRHGSDDAVRARARLEAVAAQSANPQMSAAAAAQLKRIQR